MMDKKTCALCEDETRGEFTCNECQQSFCWKHLPDHRLFVEKQMNNLMDKCKHFKDDRKNYLEQNQLFHQIDQWEKDSIKNIRIKADLARKDLQSLIKQSNEYYEQLFKQISDNIHQSKELKNYSEININQWIKELNNIQSQIENSFSIQISNQTFPNIIQINQNNKYQYEQSVQSSKTQTENNYSFNYDKFDQILGQAKLYQDNLLAVNPFCVRSFISGENSYSIGKHFFYLKIEQVNKKASSCFIGIMTLNEPMKEPSFDMKSIYGVYSSGYNVISGQRLNYDRFKRWKEKDILTFILDCDNKQIIIKNKRINWSQILNIDLNFCPFPWKFLTIIKGYKLRIINNS
jgi:hypothetical protein